MKRATITLDDDLERAVESFVGGQEVRTSLTALVQAALVEYLARRGAAAQPRGFRITPARKGSGTSDVSIQHDRYFAEE